MQLPWYVPALGAAVLWGIHYPLVDYAMERVSLAGVLLVTTLPVVLVAACFPRVLGADLRVLVDATANDRLLLLAPGLTSLAASVLVYVAIAEKNATLASLIEISYPAFVALFAFLLFRELHLTPGVVLGALLVGAGVTLIILNSP